MNFLEETPLTSVPIGDAAYGLQAQHTVARILYERCAPSGKVTAAAIQHIIADLEPWRPVVKAGRFPKRVAKYIKETWAISKADALLSTVGNYLAGDLPSDTINYAITKAFDWDQGDFGDKGSCFWTAGNQEMPRLTLSDAYALRFYGNSGNGIARAIILPVLGGVVVINCYGHNIFQVARRLKIIAPDTPVTIVPLDSINRELYINLSQGILVGVPYDRTTSGSFPLYFKLPPLPPPPPRRRPIYEGAQTFCRYCTDNGDHYSHGSVRVLSDAGVFYLCDAHASDALDEGVIDYAELSNTYHLSDEMAWMDIVIPDSNRGRSPNANAQNIYWRRTHTHLWQGRSNPETRCDICGFYADYVGYTSVAGQRIDMVCVACISDLNLSDVCERCGAYKNPTERCYCQPEGEPTSDRTAEEEQLAATIASARGGIIPADEFRERFTRPIAEDGLVTINEDDLRERMASFAQALFNARYEEGDAGGVGDVHEDGGGTPEEGGGEPIQG